MATISPESRSAGGPFDWRTRDLAALFARPARPVVVAGVVFLLAVYALLGYAIWTTYDSAITDAKRDLSTLSTLLAEETARSLNSVKVVVDAVSARVSSEALETFDVAMTDPVIDRSLADSAAGMPQLSGVMIISKDGVLLNDSHQRLAPDLNLADRSYFVELKNDHHLTYFLSDPFINRVNGDATVALSRRLVDEKGEFLGIVVGAVLLRHYENLYANLQIGEGGAVALWNERSQLLARYPAEDDAIGRVFKTGLYDTIVPTVAAQTFEMTDTLSSEGTVSRVGAVRAIEGYPLALSMTYKRDVVLRGWWTNTLLLLAAGLVVTAFGVAVVFLIARRFYDYEQTTRAIAGEHQAVLARKKLEDQLRQSQKLEAIGQLTAGIAHDFNNLLQVIVGNLEIARRRLSRDADINAAVSATDAAMAAAQKAASLTHPLLVFAKAQPLHPTNINARQLFDELAGLLSRTLGERIVVQCIVPDDIWPIHADANQLEGVLVNLALNARDAMQEKGGTLTLSMANVHLNGVTDRLKGDFVQIKVADNGVGMAPEVIDKAFEPFFTTKEVGKGSGLGLSQVFGFVDQSGGDVRIDSEIGEGTEVVMFLPRSKLAPAVGDPDVAAPSDVVMGNGETVLVVDDNHALREFAIHALRDLGYNVLEAADASDAMRTIRAGNVDLMLTDVGLPGVEGPELARHARGVVADLPVIFMTGYPESDVVTDGRLSPGDDVLFKPFKHADLSRVIAEVLGRVR